MDYNLQNFQSLAQALDSAGADLAKSGVSSLTTALSGNGLGEPQDLTPVDQYRAFIEVWTAQLTAMAAELAGYGRLCQTIASSLTTTDNAAASGLGG